MAGAVSAARVGLDLVCSTEDARLLVVLAFVSLGDCTMDVDGLAEDAFRGRVEVEPPAADSCASFDVCASALLSLVFLAAAGDFLGTETYNSPFAAMANSANHIRAAPLSTYRLIVSSMRYP